MLLKMVEKMGGTPGDTKLMLKSAMGKFLADKIKAKKEQNGNGNEQSQVGRQDEKFDTVLSALKKGSQKPSSEQ
jgi:hypothetical protein